MKHSLESLFKSHGDMVYRVCRRYVKNKEVASDLAQDVFLKINNSLSSFRGESNTLTWVYRIAVNVSLDYLRKESRRNKLIEKNQMEFNREPINSREGATLAALTLDKILLEEQVETREILFMAYLEYMSHSEIAKVVGSSRVAITKKLQKFKEKLASRLQS